MRRNEVQRLLMESRGLRSALPTNPAGPPEPIFPAHPGEGVEAEIAGWEAAWIDLGGEG